ncbi:FtsB family cell division protein [Flavobacterium selenitireducens]|uniref:FtsB family cell division protein n=1 Tax=Flavobacterium selenitireducens TaxID=2722704 RepID=UPI00168AE08F|nr:septum formation initiator family protein [Flavobacterium selenitireducens]MBD3582487.1 septum formation initiator family protein [Flavobacterium selenitireducens]
MSEETVEKKEKKTKRKWMRFIGNRYVLVSLFFIVWILFLDNYSRLNHRMLDKEIEELEENREYYKGEIKRDSQNIKLLKNPDQVEKYAREKYYMKRDSEDIYIIEYEGEKKDSSTYVPN